MESGSRACMGDDVMHSVVSDSWRFYGLILSMLSDLVQHACIGTQTQTEPTHRDPTVKIDPMQALGLAGVLIIFRIYSTIRYLSYVQICALCMQ